MDTYLVLLLHAQPESPVCASKRIAEFRTENEARYLISAAAHAGWPREFELVIRLEEPAACGLGAKGRSQTQKPKSPGMEHAGSEPTPQLATARSA